jgi:hypothetical protein
VVARLSPESAGPLHPFPHAVTVTGR